MRAVLHTDGSVSPPQTKSVRSVAGVGIIMTLNGKRIEISHAFDGIKNSHKAELLAIHLGLSCLPNNINNLTVVTDAKNIVDCFQTDWAKTRIANNWMQGRELSPSTAIWKDILLLLNEKVKHYQFQHVKSHKFNKYNKRADKLANMARKTMELDINLRKEIY